MLCMVLSIITCLWYIIWYILFSVYYILFINILTYTYIIGHYNPSVRIIDLVSHTIYVVCVNFIYISDGTERQIFLETFHGNFIYSQGFCQKSAERKSPKKYFLYFVLMSGLASNKPTHYTH